MTICDCCGRLDENEITIQGHGSYCNHCGRTIQVALRDGEYAFLAPEKDETKETVHYTITTSGMDASSFKALKGDLSDGAVIMVVSDADGNPHYFAFYSADLGSRCHWTAEEIYLTKDPGSGKKKRIRMDTHYEFGLTTEQEDDTAFERLQAKVEAGIRNRSLERTKAGKYPPDNVIVRDGWEYLIKGAGSMKIVYSSEDSSHTAFIIDGQSFTPTELATMLTCYEGSTMRYQLVDTSDNEMESDTMLLPVNVSADSLLEDLEEAIATATNGRKFMPEDRISLFDMVFHQILDKLELLYNNSPRGRVKLLGMKMIKLLEAIDTTDDVFPENEITAIREIIGGL